MSTTSPLWLPASLIAAAVVCAGPLQAQQGHATYELTFTSNWSASSHPTDFPGNPHFSSLIGATHNAAQSFWEPGQLATRGVQDVAELGSTSAFRSEIDQAIRGGGADQVIQGSGLPTSPAATSLTFTASPQHPRLTLITMLAPSPDWFVGVRGLDLTENGAWADELNVSVHVWDAGTDSGRTYNAPNNPTVPHAPIALTEHVFSDTRGSCIGTFRLRRTDRPAGGAALYEVTFTSTWSRQTHPIDFPSRPHFSSLIGATHDGSKVFWEPGCLASIGIKDLAERGRTNNLASEIDAAIRAGRAGEMLLAGGIASPGSRTLTFTATTEHPLVTLATMLAPSPDWFVGVHGLPLRQAGRWVDSIEVPLYLYDAGTDSGTTYEAPDEVTDPPQPIARVRTDSGPFLNRPGPIGSMRFVRQSSTLVYGSGVNPHDSLTVSGLPRLGQTTTLMLHDPSGTMGTPAATLVAFSSVPDARFPSGTTVPGWGLSAPGAPGELLIAAPSVTVFGASWNGAPVPYALDVPNVADLIGVELYAQGGLFAAPRLGVTDAVQLLLGS